MFAHRGGRALGPENTLEAFDRGIAAGADGLELDVHLASDGVVVVCHDPTLDRTTDARGPIATRTSADLGEINASARYGIDLEHPWTGARQGLPSLDDVLARYPAASLIIEMKDYRAEVGEAVVRAVRAAGAERRVCLGAFDVAPVLAARALAPDIATSATREEVRSALRRSWIGLAPRRDSAYRAFQVPEQSGRVIVITPRFIRAVHRGGKAVQVWTVNEEADMRRLFDWGVDGVITDRPDVAVRVREEWVRARRGSAR